MGSYTGHKVRTQRTGCACVLGMVGPLDTPTPAWRARGAAAPNPAGRVVRVMAMVALMGSGTTTGRPPTAPVKNTKRKKKGKQGQGSSVVDSLRDRRANPTVRLHCKDIEVRRVTDWAQPLGIKRAVKRHAEIAQGQGHAANKGALVKAPCEGCEVRVSGLVGAQCTCFDKAKKIRRKN